MLHILRFSPCAGNERLVQFDKLLRKGLCLITNSDLSDIQWTEASLPIRADRLGIRRVAADKSVIWSSLTGNQSRARLIAVSAPHSGDWLHALPVAACGTRLHDEAVRVAV